MMAEMAKYRTLRDKVETAISVSIIKYEDSTNNPRAIPCWRSNYVREPDI